jgi:3D-(3,5/4)-trihydroxycyclohexane-1,2-dione acylhydrolase (decyclizing)
MDYSDITRARESRATAIAASGSLEAALAQGRVPGTADVTVSEGLVLGLIRQGVTRFLGVFGHGSTEIGEVLRVYEQAGVVTTWNVRSEIEATHAATALRWVTGEKCAVFTSIGPGALHALAASLVPLSDGVGVWFLLGDETTEDEGPNMQQIPGTQQHGYLRLFEAMGQAYCLHTPGALAAALRRGRSTVDAPCRPGPFYLLLPMNTQCALLRDFNLRELSVAAPPPPGAAADSGRFEKVIKALDQAQRVVVKVGGGARGAGAELVEFLDAVDGALVHTPIATGIVPYTNPRNMGVGGSKGSISGNAAMEEADLLVAVGTRCVCQSDCSRTAYPKVERVISLNAAPEDATHYHDCIPLVGSVRDTLRELNARLAQRRRAPSPSPWLESCTARKQEWAAFKAERLEAGPLHDAAWGREVMTQPVVIKTVTDWAGTENAVCFYDAGDVQANAFQIVEDEQEGLTVTDTGASYMGFAVSALLSTALTSEAFYGVALTGDGSFVMNPQILVDGVEHGAKGCIVLLDNRRMGAISGLQADQYGEVFATADSVAVDYVAWAAAVRGVNALFGGWSADELKAALQRAARFDGLSLVHVPVYFGPDPLGGMGVFGRWNVGNWCENVQSLRHRIGL